MVVLIGYRQQHAHGQLHWLVFVQIAARAARYIAYIVTDVQSCSTSSQVLHVGTATINNCCNNDVHCGEHLVRRS